MEGTRTAAVVGAAGLLGRRVIAMNSRITRSTSSVAGAAGISASGTLTANALGGLVSVGLAASETEHLMNRHLHDGLVGHLLRGADMSSEGEDRQSGNGFGKHFGYLEEVSQAVVAGYVCC